MTAVRRALLGAACACAYVALASHAGQTISPLAPMRPISVEDIIEVATPSEVTISPNGNWVAYVLQQATLEKNHYTLDVYVVPTDGSTPPRQLSHEPPREGAWAFEQSLSLIWSPASDTVAYVTQRAGKGELHSIEIESGKESVLVSAQDLADRGELPLRYDEARSLAYSPDGRSLAFLVSASASAQTEPPITLTKGIEAGEDWAPQSSEDNTPEPVNRLFAINLQSRQITAITPPQFDIAAFAWSPDGRRIALEATADPSTPYRIMRTDILVVDSSGGTPQPLVQLPGRDREPVWSPDGRQIAFCTQHGEPDWTMMCSLAVVAAAGHTPPRYIGAELLKVTGSQVNAIHWTHNGKNIDVLVPYSLSEHLFQVSAADGKFQRLSPRDDRLYDDVSYSRDGRRVALRIQGVGVPPDVYTADTANAKNLRPKALTHLNPSWDSRALPKVQRVQWPSTDNRWDLQGLLIEPADYAPTRRYPLLTDIMGGPVMVQQTANPDWSYPLLALATQGYLVFMPNTRGRKGLGADFAHAIRDEHSYVLNPETDISSGVDALIARGIADPERLAILGFSYGGTLAAYAITQTDRYKAAIYGEGIPDFFRIYDYPNAAILGLGNDLQGFGNPYDPAVIAGAFEQSSIFRLNRVHTPVLIEAGENSGWKTDRAYFRGLRHFHVPSEFYVYPRAGHGWDEPQIRQDSFRREIAWLDHWLKR